MSGFYLYNIVLKPSSISDDEVLSVYSDSMQIEMLLNFIAKFPIKHSFLITGNPMHVFL